MGRLWGGKGVVIVNLVKMKPEVEGYLKALCGTESAEGQESLLAWEQDKLAPAPSGVEMIKLPDASVALPRGFVGSRAAQNPTFDTWEVELTLSPISFSPPLPTH